MQYIDAVVFGKGDNWTFDRLTGHWTMKILLADDHALFREGLCHILGTLVDKVSIIETADYPETIQAAMANLDLDLKMPGMDGFAGIEALRSIRPEVPLVVISALVDRRFVIGAIDRGAAGYIPKTLTGKVLIGALKLVLSGGIYVPTEAISAHDPSAGTDRVRGDGEDPPSGLTRRQTDVFALLALGLSNKEIGHQLAVSEGTVKMHVAALLKKLGVTNRTQAAVKAARLATLTGDALPE